MGDRTASILITAEDRATPVLDGLLGEHPEYAAVLPPDVEPGAPVFTSDPAWPSDETSTAVHAPVPDEAPATEGGEPDGDDR